MSELDERMRALGLLQRQARPLVEALDPADIPKGTKHAMVRAALLVGVGFLKGSVKELRAIPDDMLASGIDEAIGGAVSLVRTGVSAIVDAFDGD